MGNSKIPWLKNPDGSPGKTWPLAEGCTKVSTGCLNCCAERMYKRWHPDGDFCKVRLKPEHLDDPLHWKKPQRVLVDFMFDLFHPDVPNGFIFGAFMRMVKANQHTYFILTKRPDRMLEWITTKWMVDFEGVHHDDLILSNVWMGVSVEDQKTGDERIPLLLQTPTSVRFVSYEPALGSLELTTPGKFCFLNPSFLVAYPTGTFPYEIIFRERKKPGLDWVICGCESGPGARPMDIEWARSVRDQCQAAQVPFFFKQKMVDGKLIHMPELDGQIWAQFPEVK
ncbi:MAG: phage Gp37/Gp68 family protein [Planctomycetes bacterium]|nr:phage Gp37/Gp68 family protein [Planctomycetota bacterium]